ncbi:MAG: C40 family peptidase [candidate division KSB1 bacterium]|nr:C40 family peptidase [candidate division KSB1 bacterium]
MRIDTTKNWKLILVAASLIVFIHCATPPRFEQQIRDKERRRWQLLLAHTKARNLSIKAIKLITEIESYLGTPYAARGTSRQGMDCSGLVVTVFKKALDVDLPRSSELIYLEGKEVRPRDLKLGDLVFFRIKEGRGVSHVGIYLIGTHFVHASSKRGVIISDLRDRYYLKRFGGARRIVEIR